MISYCVTVYNELDEISRLLPMLKSALEHDDQIVIIHTYRDESEKLSKNHTKIQEICKEHSSLYCNFHFQNNFADLKNYMNSKVSSDQKYIFNFDADETMHHHMLQALREFLSQTDTDLFYLPRVNIVEGITPEDIRQWSWRVNERGWINWPDYQPRIYKNSQKIRWTSKVHEHLTGYSSNAAIEADGTIYLTHIKNIEKQRQQNQLYQNLERK